MRHETWADGLKWWEDSFRVSLGSSFLLKLVSSCRRLVVYSKGESLENTCIRYFPVAVAGCQSNNLKKKVYFAYGASGHHEREGLAWLQEPHSKCRESRKQGRL